MDKTKTYLVLNYGTSPVGVATRHDSFVVESGSNAEPTSLPFTLDEIHQINSNSQVFKTGLLRFETEYEAEIYEELRIRDWENILKNEQIEDVIVNPTIEGLQKIIDIQVEIYFERIYGIYMGLKNLGIPISQNVQNVMKIRRNEFAHNKKQSKIQLTPKDVEKDEVSENVNALKEQNEFLAKQIEEMKATMDKFVQKDVAISNTEIITPKITNTTKTTKVGRTKTIK